MSSNVIWIGIAVVGFVALVLGARRAPAAKLWDLGPSAASGSQRIARVNQRLRRTEPKRVQAHTARIE